MNGFTTIRVGDKTVSLKFGMLANRIFSEKATQNNYFDQGNLNETGIAVLLHAGYQNFCIGKEIKPELILQDFMDLVDEAIINGDTSQLVDAVHIWADSAFVKKSVEDLKQAKDDVKKKKPTGTNSKRLR